MGAEYCDDCVCLFVCLSVYPQAYLWNRTKIFLYVTYGRGSFLLRWRCDTLCTSGFMNVVMFIVMSHTEELGSVVERLQSSVAMVHYSQGPL